ncbi:Ig-like domain-containing protein [Flavilitoribacter nigricans]|uniref:Tandem-95 repeat protein n=1 Tax=Flavilitoribacter nigricans (strain ATCC 23147 / DSM 23189 / NBRC 102662 / NCIMB 1420 / SS-2) TaxID=1122177 RepID=A0A2D0NAY2_FLAN2|nr:Ig-like domain-containing protein [Flavilitoribacter nigricans]PHN05645.1 hypothetical protein CRP01_14265 [Flavilitoribacter nigricans DSM 23189 = NBRC 102662]
MKQITITTLLLFLALTIYGQNQVTYGFIQDPSDPLHITAVAYPNFSSNNVTISTSVFSFLLPEGTVTNPSVDPLPGSGSFVDITGTWVAQRLTPDVYSGIGFDPNDLQGNDVYQVVLQNSPSPPAVSGQAIELFSFDLPADCFGGNVEVLTNDGSIQQAILNNLGANFNNQISVSVDDAPAQDLYFGNDPSTFSYACPLDGAPIANDDIASVDEDAFVEILVLNNDDFGVNGPAIGAITIFASPANGTVTVNDGGTPNDPTDDTITYTPDPDFNGSDSFQYQICDADGDCDEATVSVTVNPINDLPTAVDDVATTDEDVAVLIDVLVNDDFGGDGPSNGAITIFSSPANGTVTVNDGGTPNDPTDDTITYTPNANYNGSDSFEYEICDSNGDCDQATVSITINPVNDLPTAVDDIASVDEDAFVNIPVTANDDFGGDGPALADITIFSSPANGMVTVDNGGTPNDPTDDSVIYTPNANYFGSDSFEYEICDANGDCDQATVNVTINPVNDLPTAVDDVASVDEDAFVNIPVTANDDFGGDGPAIADITIFSSPANGTVTVDDGGTPNDPTDDSVIYTPNANYFGSDSFEYEICDANGDCDQATVSVTINAVNDLPTAVDDVVSVDEDDSVNIPVTANDDFGGDGPALADITIVDSPDFGTVVVDDNGTANDPTDDIVIYTPDPDYFGNDSFTYQMCDANGDCDVGTVNITVDPVNDLPTAVDDVASVDEDAFVNIPVTANDDFGGDGPAIADITIFSSPANGTVTVDDGGTPNDPTDDSVIYTPNANYFGSDSFEYEICDANGDCDQATVSVTINAVNDLPTAVTDNVSVDEDDSVNIPVTANDDFGGDGPALADITIVDSPDFGTVVVDNNGTANDPTDDIVIYTPDPNYFGNDSFTYQMCDANGDCDVGTVNITVDPVNDLPTAVDDVASVDEDAFVNIPVTANDDFGGDGPAIADITIFSSPANGTVTVDDGGTPNDPTDDSVIYTPNANYFGSDSFEYEICDANGDCDQATVNVTINPVDDTPAAGDDVANVDENGTTNIDVTNNDDFGGDGPATGTITIVDPPNNGVATVNDNGTANDPTDDFIEYTPDPNFYGTDEITYEICDANGTCDQATISINVNAVNVRLQVRVLLQGALLGTGGSVMRDDLRSDGVIPNTEPYAGLGFGHTNGGGGETVTNPGTVFADLGSNSIVDWVFVELRSSADLTQVVATRAGLVQRDGDVVDVDGTSPLLFTQSEAGSYYVAVRHRNHLGTMTNNAIALSATGTTVDFTNGSLNLWDQGGSYNGREQVSINGVFALWAGNTNANASVVYAGQSNDKDPIFNEVDQAPGNFFKIQTYIYNGYFLGDVNMDGSSIFAGQNNDVDPIFNNVDGHPVNVFKIQTFIIPEQLAK